MWKDLVSDAPDERTTVDTIDWLGRATLDVWVFISRAVSVLDG